MRRIVIVTLCAMALSLGARAEVWVFTLTSQELIAGIDDLIDTVKRNGDDEAVSPVPDEVQLPGQTISSLNFKKTTHDLHFLFFYPRLKAITLNENTNGAFAALGVVHWTVSVDQSTSKTNWPVGDVPSLGYSRPAFGSPDPGFLASSEWIASPGSSGDTFTFDIDLQAGAGVGDTVRILYQTIATDPVGMGPGATINGWGYVDVRLDGATIWVDFAFVGSEDGSFDNPYSTMAGALAVAMDGDVISIKPGTTSETFTSSTAVSIEAPLGTVRIGEAPARGARGGFVTRATRKR